MNPRDLSVLQLRSSAGLYGADRMVLTLNGALARDGVRSRLLSINNYRMSEQHLHQAARDLSQNAELLPCRGRLDTRTVGHLVTQLDTVDASVLHVHDYKSAFYAWVASRRRPTRLVATLHGAVGGSHAMRLYNRLELALLRRFDALVVVAASQVEPLLRAGIAPHRIQCIDNGIELPLQLATPCDSLRSELGLQDRDFVFGAVGRLSPEKNLSMLLDAFAHLANHRNAVLVLAGDGPERIALEALTDELGLRSRVRFLGARNDMQRIYPLFDCLVLPSLTEGMPLVVLEAMAHALPVIASAVGDVPRLLGHSGHGRLVAAGHASALRDALAGATDTPGRRDPEARRYVLAHHSATAMADRYLDLYQSLQAYDCVRQRA